MCDQSDPPQSENADFDRFRLIVPQRFDYVRLAALLLYLAGIGTEFSVAITTQFCFTYTLDGVTAILRALHARLCLTFLVFF